MVTTERAKHFYNPQDIPVTLYSDSDEWEVSAGPLGLSSITFLPTGQNCPPLAYGPGGQSRQAGLKSAVRAIWAEAMRKTSV